MATKWTYVTMAIAAAAVGCGKKDSSTTAKGKVNLSFKTGSTSLAGDLGLSGNGTFEDLPISAAATTDGVSSLKMYFREIKICTSLSFASGGGYTIDGTCAQVYSNMSDEYTGTEAPTAADRTRFAAAATDKFYDVLSATDRAKLNRAVDVEVGDYNWGIIETHPWVKMVAKSGTVCTAATGAKEVEAVGGDGVKTYHTAVDSLDCPASGAAEEVLTFITNANTTFKFNKPFSLKEGQELTVDLAMNMDSEVKVIKNNSTYYAGNLRSSTGNNAFYVPMIRIGAAPRLAAETTKVETYTLGTPAQKEQLRVQLYYNSADATKSVLGINTTTIATAVSTKSKANSPVYANSVSVSGETVTVKTWDGTDLLTFTRGAAGTAAVICSSAGGTSMSLEECSGKTTVSLTYEAPVTTDL